MKNIRKGQYYITKPIALIMIIIVIFVLFYSLQTYNINALGDAQAIDLIADTSSTIAILTNSEDCLAYNPLELGVYGSIVSIEKLNDFQKKYRTIEPECARDYIRGWHAEVKDLMTDEAWSFGAQEYEEAIEAKVLDNKKVSSMPIAIRYSAAKVNPGRIEISTYDGDLEQISGFIDHVCMAGRINGTTFSNTAAFYVDHPIIMENNTLCLVLGKDKICRDLYCDSLFEGIKSPGEYKLSAKYVYTTDMVVVKA